MRSLGTDRHRRRRLLIRIPWLFAVDHQTSAGTLLAILPNQSSVGKRGAGAVRLVGHVVTFLLAPKMYLIRKVLLNYFDCLPFSPPLYPPPSFNVCDGIATILGGICHMAIKDSILQILCIDPRMLAADCTLDPTLNGDPMATPCRNSKIIKML